MKKNHLLLLIIPLLIAITTLYKVNILPIVKEDDMHMQETSKCIHKKGDLINPLKEIIQFDELEIYIYIHRDDISELPINFPQCKVLYTNNKSLIESMINNFNFVYTGSDMASCESILCVKSNERIVYKVNIAFNNRTIGLQDINNGWIESSNTTELIKVIKKFDSVYKPIVVM